MSQFSFLPVWSLIGLFLFFVFQKGCFCFSKGLFFAFQKGREELASLDRNLESWRRKCESSRGIDWESPLRLQTKAQRKKKVLENKLELSFGKMGQALATAKAHRKTIDDFRWEGLREEGGTVGQNQVVLRHLQTTFPRARE